MKSLIPTRTRLPICTSTPANCLPVWATTTTKISNWSQPGLASRHNLAYWRNLPYLGVGPGAHSCLGGHRFWDMDPPRGYIEAALRWAVEMAAPPSEITTDWLETVGPVGGCEFVDNNLAAAEDHVPGACACWKDWTWPRLQRKLGIDLAVRYGPQLNDLVELGLLVREGSVYRLHPSAYLIANQVFTRFLD